MYLFDEMHIDSEHIAVPHPPQCAHWGTFPPGEGIAFRHTFKHQLIDPLGKTETIRTQRTMQSTIPTGGGKPPPNDEEIL